MSSSVPLRPFAFLLLALIGCREAPAVKTPPAVPMQTAFPIPADRKVDDLARFLAGVPGRPGSAFLPAESSPVWKLHTSQSDLGWQRFLTQRQPQMREFTKTNLSEASFIQPTLFYPFGGPDIMTAQTFFPAASTYVLVGLEPPGSLPDRQLVQDAAASYLPKLRGSLGSILSKSFFITKEMDLQLRGQAADGLLPVMLIELVRNGNTVRGLRYLTLDAQGNWVPRETSVQGINEGVVVEFADPAGVVRRLAYFSLNLHNSQYAGNLAFHQHLKRLGPFCSMFKSASYMPHKDQFGMIRGQVLDLASAVVQDDSGIPFRFYEAGSWTVKLFGHYDHPYGSFRNLKQEDLRRAYTEREQVGELPFSIGYGFGRMKSNLLVARKKT